jgi:hypothetical protein
MNATPDDARARVEQLTILTDRLTGMVAEQAKCFEARRPQDALRYGEEVGRLANLYRHESARVRGNPGLVAAAPKELRQRLIRATEAFDAVLARQARAVEASKTVTEGLVRAIAEEVAGQRNRGISYGANGTQTTHATSVAITLNKRA